MGNVSRLITPIVSTLSAFSIVLMVNEIPANHSEFIITNLMLLHTVLSIGRINLITQEKWKIVMYMYALLSFLIFNNSTPLLMLNIFQSFDSVFILRGREVGINNTKA